MEGSDPGCEDPFASADAYYWEECLASKSDGRDSFSNNNQNEETELYSASHCIKVSGIFSK